MRILPSIAVVLLLPCSAFALDFRDASLLYTDAPFPADVAAAISVLTNIGAVQGDPDGKFHDERELNRAEFLKVSFASHPKIRVSPSDARPCFPDVDASAWFSRYVCLAEVRGIVKGFPDGLFHPERPVTYAEALKILGELYGYTAYAEPDAPWYQMYVQIAINRGTILPVSLPYDHALTRGQMARLAAAFRADSDGELATYRERERGLSIIHPPRVISDEEPQPVEPPTPQFAAFTPPTQSTFLLLGQRAKPIADATFFATRSDLKIIRATATLSESVASVESLTIVDELGVLVGILSLDLSDVSRRTWTGRFIEKTAYRIPATEKRTFALLADLRSSDAAGVSGEEVHVRNFVFTGEQEDGNTVEPLASIVHYPSHQTAKSRIILIPPEGESRLLVSGGNQELGSFALVSDPTSSSELRITRLYPHLRVSEGVMVDDVELQWENGTVDCSMNAGVVVCDLSQSSARLLGDTVLNFKLIGDVSVEGVGQSMRMVIDVPGSTSTPGAIEWSDGEAEFHWVEGEAPLVEGPLWQN